MLLPVEIPRISSGNRIRLNAKPYADVLRSLATPHVWPYLQPVRLRVADSSSSGCEQIASSDFRDLGIHHQECCYLLSFYQTLHSRTCSRKTSSRENWYQRTDIQ